MESATRDFVGRVLSAAPDFQFNKNEALSYEVGDAYKNRFATIAQ